MFIALKPRRPALSSRTVQHVRRQQSARFANPSMGDTDIFLTQLRPDESPPKFQGGNARCAAPRERVEHDARYAVGSSAFAGRAPAYRLENADVTLRVTIADLQWMV